MKHQDSIIHDKWQDLAQPLYAELIRHLEYNALQLKAAVSGDPGDKAGGEEEEDEEEEESSLDEADR